MATHSSTLAWKISRTVQLAGLQSMRSRRGGHDSGHTHLDSLLLSENCLLIWRSLWNWALCIFDHSAAFYLHLLNSILFNSYQNEDISTFQATYRIQEILRCNSILRPFVVFGL